MSSSSSISEDESATGRTPRSNASSSLISSCRKLAAEKPPLESVSVGSSSARLSVDSGGAESRRKTMSKHGTRGVAKSCKMLVGMQSEGPDRDAERRPAGRGDGDAGDGEEAGGYLGLRHFLGRLSSSDERTDEGQERQDATFAVKESTRYAASSNDTGTDRGDNDNNQNNLTNPNNGYHRDLLMNNNNYKHVNGSRSTRHETVREANDPTAGARDSGKFVPQVAQQKPSGVFSDDENGEVFDDDVELKQPIRERISYTKRKLAKEYDNQANEQYMTLPTSTHTLLHTEPIFSVAFIFSLGIAALSASCLLLVLVNEMSKGQKGNLLDVPTGVSSGVRGAQFCGIFVGLLMEEEIPQGLLLLRSISRASLSETYPELSFTRFVLSCLLRLVMGYLFLLNLFVTIVQADDVITIFFDILALEFVQHLDDMAFDLGRKDMLGRSLNLATLVEYNVLTREGLKQAKKRNDEENALIQRQNQQKQEENSNVARISMFHFLCRRKKKIHFRWILKAAYFINLAGLLTGTIIVGENQKKGHYHCESVSVMFGDQVWQNAYVTNWTDPSQAPQKETLVYSYFNGVYRITDTDSRGYPVYTEMNKVSGDAYLETVGAEIVYCQAEEAWVFRHRYISKVDIFSDDEDECLQWLLRSPQTNVYDLIDVQHDDWSVWTGIITPGNKVSIICNVCDHNSDCNYHGECGQNGKCFCNPGFYGLHCEFEEFCDKLIDDDGEVYTLITDTENKALLSYTRPIYASRPLNVLEISQNTSSEMDIHDESDTFVTAENSTDYDVLVAEETTSDNTISAQASTSASTSCYPEAQKVRLESTTGEQIAMFELQAYSSGTNVALQGTASQSSDRNNGEILDASRAIDGRNTTFSHTNDANAMWEVDLGGFYPIDIVLIVNRYCGNIADPLGCLCRLSNATLTLRDETESIVAVKNIGNTCGQFTVSASFTPSYACPYTFSTNSTSANTDKSMTVINGVTNATNTRTGNSTQDETSDNWPMDVQLWGSVVLVYSGSRWFGTMEISPDEVLKSSKLIYDAEYHAFWDMLYEGRTFFISDPTSGATPVGTDFYENQVFGKAQWDDYGPFGLLTPLNNITGKGYFHCMGTNISAVKVASGTGDYGE